MRKRAGLIAGLACGLVCVLCIALYVSDVRAGLERERAEALARFGGEQVEVYVATRDIAAGSAADASCAEKRLWLGELLPTGAVTDLSSIEGQPAASTVYAGEVLVSRRFGARDVAALQVPTGLVAVSVPAKAVTAVGGSVKPGDAVDVYATSGTSTDLLAEGVSVLATSASSAGEEASAAEVAWVTLAAKPAVVAELIAAANASELYFALPASAAGAREG